MVRYLVVFTGRGDKQVCGVPLFLMRRPVYVACCVAFDLLNFWISSSDISGYHADFHEEHGTVGVCQGRGMACMN
jgi:hypothetical protein